MCVCVCVCVYIKFGTKYFVVRLSIIQNQYRHKRRIVRAETVIVHLGDGLRGLGALYEQQSCM